MTSTKAPVVFIHGIASHGIDEVTAGGRRVTAPV